MKKSFIITAILTMVLATTAVSCNTSKEVKGSKNYITRRASLENFHSLRVAGSPDVVYIQSNKQPGIEIYGQDNIVPLIEAIIENGTLIIKFKKNTTITNVRKLEIKVTGPALREATVQGSGDISFADGMKTDNALSLQVRGSGDIDGNRIEAQTLDLRVQGSGDIKLHRVRTSETTATVQGSGDIHINGKSRNANYKVNGSGDIHAQDLEVENVEARVSGSGDIRCFATKTLTGGVSGSGDVSYKGNPEISFSKKGLRRL